jgi:hypothetical protein
MNRPLPANTASLAGLGAALICCALPGAAFAQAPAEGGVYIAGYGIDFGRAAEQGMARNPPGQRFFLLALPPNTVALTKAAASSDVAVRDRIAARGAVLMVCQRDIDNGSIDAAALVPGVVPVRGFPPRGSNAIPRGERYYPDEDRATLPRNNNSLKRLRKACT